MKQFQFILLIIIIISNNVIYAQFNDYTIKYGFQTHLIQPSTEFDTDSYRLSLLGRGFLRVELNSIFETEIGVGIGELNGKDFQNDNWSTVIFPTDLKLIFSPLNSSQVNPYIYSGMSLLRWKISDYPTSVSPKPTKDIGWNLSIPVGAGIEIRLSDEVLFDINLGYTYALTDDLNYLNKPTSDDGFFNLGFGLTFVMGIGNLDEDNDGLNHDTEISIGTNPNDSDTDKDSLDDGVEINNYKTNPLKIDSDEDGLSDYEEVIVHNTDPNSHDTDGDDLSDFVEVDKYNTSPLDKDSDKDGLQDGYEVNIYSTNPANDDTDKDRLNDNEEIKIYKTDPTNPDTDGDGLSDGEEILKYNTNPLVKDSENFIGRNDDKIINLVNNQSIVLKGINFELNKSEITKESEQELLSTLNSLKKDPTLIVEIRGYTDNVGNAEYNKKLSQQRADAVRLWLVNRGIDALRMKAIGYGEDNPIADNNTLNGRNQNRRIEIIKVK